MWDRGVFASRMVDLGQNSETSAWVILKSLLNVGASSLLKKKQKEEDLNQSAVVLTRRPLHEFVKETAAHCFHHGGWS